MRDIKHILLPGEQVLFSARVHPVIYVRGFFFLALAFLVWRHGWSLIAWWPWAAGLANKAIYYVPPLNATRKILTFVFTALGAAHLANAYLVSTTTYLVVTLERIVAQFGVTTLTSIEMERQKIAGIVVLQPMMGRLLDYGAIWIRGFSGDIHGLPYIAQPKKLQAAIGA